MATVLFERRGNTAGAAVVERRELTLVVDGDALAEAFARADVELENAIDEQVVDLGDASVALDALPLIRGGVRALGQRLQGLVVGGLFFGGV